MLNYKYLLALIVLASYVQAAAIPQGVAFRAAGLSNVESDALTLKEPAFDDTSTILRSDHVYLVETEHPPEEPRGIVKDVEKVLSHLRRSDHVYLVETEHPPEEPRDQTNLLPVRQIITVFLALSLCALVTSLDSLIVSSSLATVSALFNAGAVSSWVPAAYLLSSTTTQPLYGRFSDIFGRKNVLCLAMAIYIFGNLIAGFLKSIIQLIVSRGIAGAGGGGITSMLQILISACHWI
ncbi:MFS general substrate transporter [Gymnopus androsaceus JB14]|uniref:MFS general substrate transporter n=1 Tax=Gymnopus androsaceus JB14 TaxID=1447944 RepID=A0A6A4GXW2_9AGAR|nr:MFS general substrate transporter [Gymnopus androsaceus JB14]